MMHGPAFRRFAFAFGAAFSVLYVVAVAKKLALFTVYPSLRLVVWGAHYSHDIVDPALGFVAPAMYWYGWAATAALGALAVGFLAAAMPERWVRRIRPGWLWIVLVAAMLGCAYLALPWFSLNP